MDSGEPRRGAWLVSIGARSLEEATTKSRDLEGLTTHFCLLISNKAIKAGTRDKKHYKEREGVMKVSMQMTMDILAYRRTQ